MRRLIRKACASFQTRFWSYLLASFLLVCACVAAHADRFEARLFDQSNGLENLTVTSFAQQADGQLWIGTVNGLFRYDGSLFTEFGRTDGLNDPSVFSLLVDSTGTLWAGTHNGLFRFDGSRFHEVFSQGHSFRIGINSMLASTPAGELILETSKGIFSVTRATPAADWESLAYGQRHPAFPRIEDTDGIALGAQGHLWFGCASSICLFDGRQTQRFGADQGVPDDYYVSLFRARDGRLWARGRKHILTLHQGDARFVEVTATLPADAIHTTARRFTEDAHGNILTPTAHGFATWNGSSWKETLSTSKGPINGASDIFCDREGSVWVGTGGFGLLQSLGYGQWQNYSTAEGLNNTSVQSIAADSKGTLWLGDDVGISRKPADSAQFQPLAAARFSDHSSVTSLAASPDGGMWTATLLGQISHLSADGRPDFHTSLDGYVQHIALDHNGTLWIAAITGLYSLDRRTPGLPRPVMFSPSTLSNGQVSDVLCDPQGDTWVTSRHGLDRIHNNTITHVDLPAQGSAFTALARADDGSFWIAGAMPGILHVRVDRIVTDGAETLRGTVLGTLTRPVLASDLIEFLAFDRKKRLWVGTDHGVNVLDGEQVFHLTTEDGLIWNICSEKTFYAQSDGSIWIGTSLGVSHLLHPDHLLHRSPFAVSIEAVHYGSAELGNSARLPWNGGPMQIHFTGLTFHNNESLVYQYRLKGGTDQSFSTTEPFATFDSLAPGSYSLEVTAEDPGHRTISPPAIFAFTLTPPWWRQPITLLVAVLLLLGSLAFAWQWWHLALLRRQRRLEQLIEERTRELQQMALQDALTGLPNRSAVFAALRSEFEHARKTGFALCAAIVDLDHFKRVNDTLGHQAGDEVLREAAQRLSASVRVTDIVGRYGGEEFLVLFRGATREPEQDRCELLRQALGGKPILFGEHALHITCSIGLACSRGDGDTLADLLSRADKALYIAKENGRNRVETAA